MEFIEELNDVQKQVYGGFREAQSMRDVQNMIGDPESVRMQVNQFLQLHGFIFDIEYIFYGFNMFVI